MCTLGVTFFYVITSLHNEVTFVMVTFADVMVSHFHLKLFSKDKKFSKEIRHLKKTD